MKNHAFVALSVLLILFCLAPAGLAAPGNDAFSAPTPIQSIPATLTATNVGATLEANESLPADEYVGASVWFDWTPGSTETIRLDTRGSDLDTVLAVWTGNDLATLTEIVANDDHIGGTSQVQFNAVAGVRYRIAVYGYDGETGDFTLNLSKAPNTLISGTITAANGVTPLMGIDVIAYQWNESYEEWGWVAGGVTQENGSYQIAHLNPGTYRLQFIDYDEEFAGEYYDSSPTVDAAADIVVGPDATVAGIDASLAELSRITGTVTGPDGVTPLQNIRVTAYEWDEFDEEWYSGNSSTTRADGSYQVTGLGAGNFRILFYDNAGGHLIEYYNDSTTLDSAQDIAVGVSVVVSGINASLAKAGRVTGMVTGPDGATPLEDIDVEIYRWDAVEADWTYAGYDYTQEDGSYNLGNLQAGTYRVAFYGDGLHTTEYYDNAPTLAAATDIVVAATATVTGIDAALAERSRITGTVTGPDGITPLENIRVTAYEWDEFDEEWYPVNSANTGEDGSYQVPGLNAGNFRIRFYDTNGGHLTEYYNDSLTLGSAQDIAVGVSVPVSGINASLATAARITGTVTGPDGITPLEDIDVDIYRWDTIDADWTYAGNDYTQEDGSYNFGYLEAGTYRIVFYGNGEHLTEYYDNAPTLAAATDIVVAASATVTGINASLALASGITGTVTGPDGATPLEDIYVTAYEWDETDEVWYQVRSSYTAEDGSYRIRGLSAGTYRIRFLDSDSEQFVTEFYSNSATLAEATSIVLGSSTTVTGTDASLAEHGGIRGKVTGPDGMTPLEDIRVTAYLWDDFYAEWYSTRSTYTSADGSYQLSGLDTESYRLRFVDESGTYPTAYYADAANVDSATSIFVGISGIITGINASLGAESPPQPRIAGFRKTGATSFELDFEGIPGGQYRLQQSTTLGAWTDVGDPFTCLPAGNTLPMSSSEPEMFWRVRSFP